MEGVTGCARFALDTQGQNALWSVPVKPSSYHLTHMESTSTTEATRCSWGVLKIQKSQRHDGWGKKEKQR